MITLLHGEDLVSLRNHLFGVKKNSEVFIELNILDLHPSEIIGSYFSSDLFSTKRVLAIEVSKVSKTFDFEYLLEKLQSQESINDLIFFSYGTLGKTHPIVKSKISRKEFNDFKKSNIFSFLDAVFEKRRKDAYSELETLLIQREDGFMIFSMIVSGLRNISYALNPCHALDKLHPFVKAKSLKQAKMYSNANISTLCEFMYTSDLKLKTGELSIDLFFGPFIEKVNSL